LVDLSGIVPQEWFTRNAMKARRRSALSGDDSSGLNPMSVAHINNAVALIAAADASRKTEN